MNRTGVAIAAVAAAALVPWISTGQPTKPAAKTVEGAGCVEAGVEAGCLIVKDLKSGKVFNLIVKAPQPAVGEGIEFRGTLFSGVTACMQGTAVEVTNWEPKASLNCRTPEK